MKAPAASSINALRTMQANQRVSGMERRLRSALWRSGIRGYRVQTALPGRPDIVFPREKVAILVHGCFWHSCPRCALQRPKANGKFWQVKLDRNVTRDEEAERCLTDLGWRVIVIWEHEVVQDLESVVRRLTEERRFRRPSGN